MTINEFQRECIRTANEMNTKCPITIIINGVTVDALMVNGLIGLNGEAGEAIDILKKHLFHGHELDREHLAKELGDVAWYLAVTAKAIGYDLETIFQMNIDKLKARYPDGFSIEKSLHRAEGDV
ncbi:MAG: nucleoside triphosphate pyrophosphohydrolase family protein [Oscillospiraceae bacterium]|nr:nucleoside triphosphate pyrophosphohydrolase family protein [Oscillospiraceae bacterium]